jgi:hypothetical protein
LTRERQSSHHSTRVLLSPANVAISNGGGNNGTVGQATTAASVPVTPLIVQTNTSNSTHGVVPALPHTSSHNTSNHGGNSGLGSTVGATGATLNLHVSPPPTTITIESWYV